VTTARAGLDAPLESEELAQSTGRCEATFSRRDALYCAALLLVGFGLRALVVCVFDAPPTWDGAFYQRGAISIAEGHGYSEAAQIAGHAARLPWSHYPVGYSALLGATYALFGTGRHVATLLNAVIGGCTAALSFAFAFEVLGRARARIAGALAAIHPGLVLYCALVMTEPLAGFLVLASGYLALKLGQLRWGAVASGVILALSAFVRPQSLITAPLLLLLFRGSLRRRLSQTALAGAVCFASIAPWSVRNCLELDGCALISTNGGWNLAISALSETGRFRPLTPEDGCRDIDGPVAQDRCWANLGIQVIESDPWKWLARIPDKLRHTYNHESFAVAYLAEAQPAAWDEARKFRAMNLITGLHHLLCFVAALSAVSRVSWRIGRQAGAQLALVGGLLLFGAYALSLPDKPLYWIVVAIPIIALLRLPGSPSLDGALGYLYGLLALTSLTHMIFFGDDRYHLAISPVLCILAAAAFRRPARSPAPPLQLAPQPS
jgi:hypothetical protein